MTCKQWMTFAGVGLVLAGMTAARSQDTWADTISMKGDLRLRHELIDQDNKPETRNRWRLRARISLKGEVNDMADVHVRLASGGDDPVSTNQSLDDGFTSKGFQLDRAYLELRPGDGVALWGGKTPMPFEAVSDLVWDGDLNPEGVALRYTAGAVFFNTAAWWAEERSSTDDTMMYGAQLGAETDAGETVSVMGGLSYFYWDNLAGFAPLYDDSGFGNTLVNVGDEENPEEVFATDYGVFEAFCKVGLKTFMPVSFYGNYIVNTEADTNGDTGFLIGASLGKAKDVGSFALNYNYRDLEADATVGTFSDSDVFGGGTNGTGHKFSGTYQLAKNLQAGATLFLSSLDPDGADIDYTRAQFDLLAKF